jgi:cyanophycinase
MSVTTMGTLALIGAGEYLPPIAPVDTMLLERIDGAPRVVVLPTASMPDGAGVPEHWAKLGVDHFTQLGATVEPVMLLRRSDADDTSIVSQIAAANFVYLSGGKPRYLLETLQGTAAWQAILNVLAAGGVLAGCSAGAMVLGGELVDFPQLWHTIPAFGLVPEVIVIPHFDEIPKAIISTISLTNRKATFVGIDGSTALVGSNGVWSVSGNGGVTVFNGGKKIRYHSGEQVALPS